MSKKFLHHEKSRWFKRIFFALTRFSPSSWKIMINVKYLCKRAIKYKNISKKVHNDKAVCDVYYILSVSVTPSHVHFHPLSMGLYTRDVLNFQFGEFLKALKLDLFYHFAGATFLYNPLFWYPSRMRVGGVNQKLFQVL